MSHENAGYFVRVKAPAPLVMGASGALVAAVDTISHFGVNATTGALTFTLPAPGLGMSGHDIRITNVGANTFTMYGVTIGVDQYADFSWDAGTWHSHAVPASTCPAPMTRAALLTLRSGNALQTNCPYIITDIVQGRLVAGTTVTMHAVSANELSEDVDVNTTYDNAAWRGRYDIDRNVVMELTDNLGNTARGYNGTEVSNFDWGNGAYNDCLVSSATLTVTYGATVQCRRLQVTDSAVVNIAGMASPGQFQDTTITKGSVFTCTSGSPQFIFCDIGAQSSVTATGANLILRRLRMADGLMNISNATSGATLNDVVIENNSVLYLQGVTGWLLINDLRIEEGSTVNIFPGVTTTTEIVSTSFRTGATLNKRAGSGNLTLQYTTFSDITTLNLNPTQTGNVLIRYGAFNNTANLQFSGPGAFYSSQCVFNTNASFQLSGSGSVNMEYTIMSGGAQLVTDPGNFQQVNIANFKLHAGVIRTVGAGAAGASLLVTFGECSRGYIYLYGAATAGTLSISGISLQADGQLRKEGGTRNLSFSNCGSVQGIVRSNGTGAFSDSHSSCTLSIAGVISYTCSGGSNLVQAHVGAQSQLNLSGTTGLQSITNVEITNGSVVNIANCPADQRLQTTRVGESSAIVLQNNATSGTNAFCGIERNSTMQVNGVTGVYANYRVTLNGGAVFSQSGAATGADTIECRQRASMAQNGGFVNRATLIGPKNITTGNFTHTDIGSIFGPSKTLTVANTSRYDYAGINAAQQTAPLI